MNKRMLIVDDDEATLRTLSRVLRPLKLQLYTESCVKKALSLCEHHSFDLILSDQHMPVMEGTEFLSHIAKIAPDTIRIILSGYADFEHITQAFNNGILHKFINKPWDKDELLFIIKSLLAESTDHTETLQEKSFHGMLSNDSVMHELFKQLKKLATANAPIYLNGETGTGKELAAKAVHQESFRHSNPFVAVNCANFTEQMMEAELFGHKKGAFTGAVNDRSGLIQEADGGTLFLDEITTLPFDLQAKLLRVLQERRYRPVGGDKEIAFDVQLISASSELISDAVAEGRFRADLQYRVDVLPLYLPPLRERGEDAALLFRSFINQLGIDNSVSLSNTLMQTINTHPWPGNVRQLYNIAQYVAATFEGTQIETKDLPAHLLGAVQTKPEIPAPSAPLNQLDKEALHTLLQQHQGNKTATASALGVSRMTLWRRIKTLGLN
jgi:DNA-binding NtrC family response regulator